MEDDFHNATREHALSAARRAVGSIEQERTSTPTMFGRVALLTWGCIALASAAFALTIALDPPTERIVAGQPEAAEPIEELAEAEPFSVPETALRSSDIDEILTGTATPSTELPDLYGGEIGRDVSIAQLASRYERIAQRMPVLFGGLDPLIRIEEESADLAASLVAGPFETMDDARLFCRTMRLQLTIDCTATPYTGETFLAR